MVKQIADMKKTIEKLESDKKTLTAGSNDKDNRIRSLERDAASLNQTLTARENTIATQESTIAARENTIAARDRTITNRNNVLTRIRSEIEGGKNVDDMSFNEIKDSLGKIQDALRGLTP